MQIGEGMVSQVYLHNGRVSKQYFTPFHNHTGKSIQEHWDRELEALKIVSGRKHFPKLIKVDEVNRIIIMSYCGEALTKENLPSDWKKQCRQIERVCRELSVFNRDFIGLETNTVPPHHKNILVKDGIIHIIDFGIWADGKSTELDSITSIIRKVFKSIDNERRKTAN